MEIFYLDGALVWSGKRRASPVPSMLLVDLNEGMYFIRITDVLTAVFQTQKLVVLR